MMIYISRSKSFRPGKALAEFERFIKAHDIIVTEIDKPQPFWIDNFRSENKFDPTEQAPSFKSKW